MRASICPGLFSANPYLERETSASSSRLRLGLLLRLCILLLFLLLLIQLLIRLALETRLLLGRLLNRLEEALQATLLCTLHVLLQLGRTVPDSVLVEVLLLDEELDEALDVRGFPLEVAFWGVGWTHVGLEEEGAGIGEGPVFGECEFVLAGLDVSDYAFEVLVVANHFEGSGGADALDGVEVITAEEDTEVDELLYLALWVGSGGKLVLPVPAPYLGLRGPCPGGSLGWALSAVH
jgi:hypothetical protein